MGRERRVGPWGRAAPSAAPRRARVVHGALEEDMASKVARSPEEDSLALFSPGPEGHFSARITEAVRAALLPSACDLWFAGTCGCKCRIPDEHPTCRWLRARCQNPPPLREHAARGQLGPSPLPSTGSAGRGCRWEAEL